MKRIVLSTIILIFALSCSKDSLKLENPNEPGLEALRSEEGMQKAALGVYHPMRESYFVWFAYTNHNVMGDVTTASAGNFGWRWINQVTSITRPNGTVVKPSQGGTQGEELGKLNSRDYGTTDNPFAHEWVPMYGTIGHANLMLDCLKDVEFIGTDLEKEVKEKTYRAWFLWWKGFAYSRIGSIYGKGLIVDTYGETVTNYVSNREILLEAEKNFNEAKSALQGIAEDDPTYGMLMKLIIPTTFQRGKGGPLSPKMFERNINTYLARNILVNKYAKELTGEELSAIETLAANGVEEKDLIFNVRSSANGNVCFVYSTAWSPRRLLQGWEFVSERLVQDFKEGDERYTRNIVELPEAMILFNPRGRGFSYGTRYTLKDIKNGGDYASAFDELAEIPLACCYEENQLMLAESKIRKDQIDEGVKHIDAVRAYQKANLPALAGTGLSKEEALEELRKERRVGLFLKGTAFYDARRWEVVKPVSAGGGRTNANVVVSVKGEAEACTIDYNYLEWWLPPALETDFNPINP